MAQTDKPALNLYPDGQEDSTYTWVLEPPSGQNSFRIVMHSRRTLRACSPEPHSWSSYFGAIAHLVLTILTLAARGIDFTLKRQ
jgi:hypothetical protein